MNRRLRATIATVIIAAGLSTAGCATDSTALDEQTSQQWQARVVAIAESAEAGDPATALVELAALEADAAQARQDGEISAERAAIIQQSVDVVRADLETASAPVTPAPDETVVQDPVDDDETGDEEKPGSGKKDDKPGPGEKDDKKDKGENGGGDDD